MKRCPGWLLAAGIAIGIALPSLPACSGSRRSQPSTRVRTERSKKPRPPGRVSSRWDPRHPHHAHYHAHPHPLDSHHHHPHPHPHLEGADGHHHPY